MKVEGTSISPISGIHPTGRITRNPQRNTEQTADSLAVSDKGQFYNLLMEKVKELPTIREDKVQELSSQIKRGEFQVNSYLIAQNLLSGLE